MLLATLLRTIQHRSACPAHLQLVWLRITLSFTYNQNGCQLKAKAIDVQAENLQLEPSSHQVNEMEDAVVEAPPRKKSGSGSKVMLKGSWKPEEDQVLSR